MRHLRIKQYLKQQIPKFAREFIPVAIVYGLKDLVRFFEGVGLDGIKGLLAVPWTSPWAAQFGHDRNRTFESFTSSGHRFRLTVEKQVCYALRVELPKFVASNEKTLQATSLHYRLKKTIPSGGKVRESEYGLP